jgi:hypothetical protein
MYNREECRAAFNFIARWQQKLSNKNLATPIRLHVITRKLLDEFSWNFVLGSTLIY